LVAQLRRTEADVHQPEQLLSRSVRAGGLDDANDPAAVLTARLAKLAAARSVVPGCAADPGTSLG
jgi:hypothetical protein